MATVSNFENLSHPTGQELKQFAELFAPLFGQVGAETRRLAVAALSRCTTVPAAVARLIAAEPVDVSAPFLVNSAVLDEAALAEVIAAGDRQAARAIARRRSLSPATVAALAASGDPAVLRSLRVRRLLPAASGEDAGERARLAREETLREELARLAVRRPDGETRRTGAPRPAAEVSVPTARPGQVERLVAFAERREPQFFVTALADLLDCSFRLAERIMLDISGRQLAETLIATGFGRDAARRTLESLLPHLGRRQGQLTRAEMLLGGCDRDDAAGRLALWLGADREGAPRLPDPHFHDSLAGTGANRGTPPRRTAAHHAASPSRPLRRA